MTANSDPPGTVRGGVHRHSHLVPYAKFTNHPPSACHRYPRKQMMISLLQYRNLKVKTRVQMVLMAETVDTTFETMIVLTL